MTIKIKEAPIKVKTIRQGDKLWHIKSGFYMTPRAGFEINERCPTDYKQVIMTAIDLGWLKPVAYMRDDEYIWETIKDE